MSEAAAYGAPRDTRVLRRIALLVEITPQAHGAVGQLHVSDVASERELTLAQDAFVLTLENESPETFARGQLKLQRDGSTFPIQINLALFDLLASMIDGAAGTQ